MPVEFNGKQVDVNNFTEEDLIGILDFDNDSYFISLTYGTDYRFKLLEHGLTSPRAFFETGYKNQYDVGISSISGDTIETLQTLGSDTVGLSSSVIIRTNNMSGWIATAINNYSTVSIGTETQSNFIINWLGRWGGDAIEAYLDAEMNYINHIAFNSNGGTTQANNVGISSTNPQVLNVSDRTQIEWASELSIIPFTKELQNKGTQSDGVVDDIFKRGVGNVGYSTGVNVHTGSPWSLSWFLINGEGLDSSAKPPYIDENTKELVIQNKYNFKDSTKESRQDYLMNRLAPIIGVGQTANALSWWNSTPLSFNSQDLLLESASRTMKTAKSLSIDPSSNLDALDYNFFEVRISEKNLGIGNTVLRNTLINKGWL